MDEGNFPRNCWYVVASSDEIGVGLVARRVLGQPVVLFRRADGTIGALEDRCAHRAAPLSRGALVDDQVVCAYHGFTYDATGACVRVPSQVHVPYGARVRSYPVREDGPFVWIWLGVAARSQHVEPPELPALRDPGWAVQGGIVEVAANYLLLHDNALDRTHFPYVHPHRIHRGYVEGPPPLNIEVSETTVSYSRTFAPAPLADWQHEATGLPAEGEYTQRETGTFVSPALHVDEMDVLGPDGTVYRSQFIRAFTPVDPGNTRVLWRAARNFAVESAAVTERLREVYEGTMVEDQPLLEAIQAAAPAGAGHAVSAAADAAAIRAYEIVAAMLAEERPRRRR
jgi:vanillate O-demethylase monooxygenase subunit